METLIKFTTPKTINILDVKFVIEQELKTKVVLSNSTIFINIDVNIIPIWLSECNEGCSLEVSSRKGNIDLIEKIAAYFGGYIKTNSKFGEGDYIKQTKSLKLTKEQQLYQRIFEQFDNNVYEEIFDFIKNNIDLIKKL